MAKAQEAPIETLAQPMRIDPETVGNMTLALGVASKSTVIGVTGDERVELDKDLDPSRVKQRQGMDYLTEHDVVRTANRIFGYGRWGTEVIRHELIGCEQMKNSKGDEGWYVGYRCTVRLTVSGCAPVDGVGYGDAFEKQWSARITAHELAAKEAESDAIKRAFKKYGDQFGLILYAKADDKKRIAAEKAQADYDVAATDDQIKALASLAVDKGKQTETAALIEKELSANRKVRVGRLHEIEARLNTLPDAGAAPAAEPEPPLEQATSEIVDAIRGEAPPRLVLADGDRAATPDEVSAVISFATSISTDHGARAAQLIVEHRAKVQDDQVSHKWLTTLRKKVEAKAENGGAFAAPEAATGVADDEQVAAAFEGSKAA